MKLILDFGDAFFPDNFITCSGMKAAIDAVDYGNPDTLYAMVCFNMLCSAANCHANDWREGNCTRLLFPRANLTSQRISDFLAAAGEEVSLRGFFREYLSYTAGDHISGENGSIIIDTTTIIRTMNRLRATGINNKFTIADAVYYDDDNIGALYKNKNSFIT